MMKRQAAVSLSLSLLSVSESVSARFHDKSWVKFLGFVPDCQKTQFHFNPSWLDKLNLDNSFSSEQKMKDE